jgi:phage terminase small subunit
MALTPKQEKFCLAYMETGNASEAYRIAYDANGMKPESINRKAKEVMDNGKISARLAVLRAKVEAKGLLTIERLTNDLLRIAQKGEELAEAPGLSVARASLMDAAKLNGLIVDKLNVKSTSVIKHDLDKLDDTELEQLESLITKSEASESGEGEA